MQKNKLLVTLLFAVLSIFMITACSDGSIESNSDSSIESNSGGNSGGGGTVHPEPEPDLNVVKEFYNFLTWDNNTNDLYSQYAILYDGSLYAWGNNNHGQLGVGLTDKDVLYQNDKKKVNIPGKVIQLIADINSYINMDTTSSFYAITENGDLYVWGYNGSGQLGVGDEIYRNTPEKINLSGKIKTLKTSSRSVYAILEDGSLYAWGENHLGRLGVGDEVDKNTPTKVNLPGKIKELIGGLSAYAILEDGSLYAWGYNVYGQLGVGDEVDKNTPTKVNLPGTIKELIGGLSAYAILEDGSLYAWGNNNHGQLGVGDNVNKNTPTKVNLPSKIKKLIIDSGSAYAILEDGSLYAWGSNSNGILGVGDDVNRNTPTKVNLPSKIKELIIDSGSAYAILEDGSLYAWGKNEYGELGVGDEVTINTPTKVKLPSKIKELIIVDGSSAYAILEDGSLYAWGSNSNGILGVGKSFTIYTPEQVTGINGTIKEIFSSTSIYGVNRYFLTEDDLLYVTGWEDLYYPVRIEFKEK